MLSVESSIRMVYLKMWCEGLDRNLVDRISVMVELISVSIFMKWVKLLMMKLLLKVICFFVGSVYLSMLIMISSIIDSVVMVFVVFGL